MAVVDICMPEDEKEGTAASVSLWHKRPGERVAAFEPILEIDTDKVTIEIAAPASGILLRVTRAEGDSVAPGDTLGSIETEPVHEAESTSGAPSEPRGDAPSDAPRPAHLDADRATDRAVDRPADRALERAADEQTFSPAARRLLDELQLRPADIPKRSRGTRITPTDIAAYLRSQAAEASLSRPTPAPATGSMIGRKVPHTPMRRSIAAHMAHSLQAAPHVTSVFEADLSRVLADRAARRQTAAAEEVPSVTAYLIRAAIQAVQAVPEVNSRWHDEHVEIFDRVNFGVGTALDTGGLVVPVLENANTLGLESIARRLREMTRKARLGKLTRADMEGGTLTLSNHGVSGSLLATPIILPHGQAAILGAGKLQKRVVVCETGGRELFRVRPMMYVTLTVDHRVLDAQQTNAFLTAFVAALEAPAAL